MAVIIVKVLSSLFFSGDVSSLGRLKCTKGMFNPLKGRTIIWVATMIFHCVKEFESGTRMIIKFEGPENTDGK